MIKNYFKIAWRNIITRKFNSFLNIGGLTLAMSCCMLIYLYTSYNLSFDTYHAKAAYIFRLVYEEHLDKTEYDKGSAFAEFEAIKTEIPQVKQSAFLVNNQSFVVTVDNEKRFKEENTVSFTDADWFKVFTYKWLAGSASQLNEPDNAVLRKKTALKYFGNINVIGKTLLFNNRPVKITGIIADGPGNTDLKSEIYLSATSLLPLMPLYDKSFYTDWGYLNSTNAAFIVLNDPTQMAAVEKQIPVIAKKHGFGDALKYVKFNLLPLKDAHFDTRYGGSVQKSLLWNLIMIGILIMAIAIINYVNLVLAQQTRRGVEIGTRKVLGGTSRQIFAQFIIEALLTAVIAVLLSVILVVLLLPVANNYLFADEPVYMISYSGLLVYTVIMLICITIAAGMYPALALSRITIAQVMKNQILNLSAGFGRRLLVVFQNTVTQALIICTIIIVMQVWFLRNTDVGFDRRSVITIPVGQLSATQKSQFYESLAGMPAVQSFSFCNNPPSSASNRGATVQYDNRVKWETWPARFAIGDSAYCRTFGLHIISGRNIRSNRPVPEFLINETMAGRLAGKHPDDVIGKALTAGDIKGVIVGIVKDFNVRSLAEPIEASVLLETNVLQTNLAVKLSGGQLSGTLAGLQKTYQRILPDQVFSYQFVDKQIALLYQKEDVQQKLIWLAAMVAIAVSSLGLLGLISLIVLQRTKEIGIRKVLGASVSQVSMMLSRDFVLMVLAGFVIAAPVSWWAMNKWLQGFAYRIEIHWWIFGIAVIAAFLIAFITVGIQSLKAAMANPANSLRSE